METTKTAARAELVESLEEARTFDLNTVVNQELPPRPAVRAALETAPADRAVQVLDLAERNQDDFAIHPKLMRQFSKRLNTRAQDAMFDWGRQNCSH